MRCKACDNIMKPEEIIWRERLKQFDELCFECRYAIFHTDEDSEVLQVINEIIGKGRYCR